MLFRLAVVGLLLGALIPAAANDFKIHPALMKSLTEDESSVAPMFVVFAERPDLRAARNMPRAARGQFVVRALQQTAARSQGGVIGYLRGQRMNFTPYWVENKIYIPSGTLALARTLSEMAGVAALAPEEIYSVPKPEATGGATVQSVEWNIAMIGADQVWTTYGTKGSGLVVANIDTGVQYNHPALVGQYRGNNGSGFSHTGNWYDPTALCGSTPCDNNGHGTHTMGTMVGDDGGSNQIGVAPGAKWIACKGCGTSSCASSALTACAQWVMDPNQNGSGSGQPDVVNNSWGGGGGNSWYQSYVKNWRTAGIFPAFSNGNSGPACSTSGSPGDYPESFASGATDSVNAIASFSSRGPSSFSSIIKPNISAPGVNIRSSVPTNSYANYSGTSMASPHTAAAVALLWSAKSTMLGDIGGTENILRSSALALTTSETCGGIAAGAVPNNTFGYGRLNVKNAVDMAQAPANQAPVATILTPHNGDTVNCNTSIGFTGTATDYEDGTITAAIQWSVGGVGFGSGGSVTKNFSCAAETGFRTVTATVVDSKGAADSDAITINVVDPSIPSAPANLTASVSGSTVTLHWQDTSSNETGFRVERKLKIGKNSTNWQAVATLALGTTTYSESGLAKGQYQYRVFAVNGPLLSAPSNTVTANIR